MLGKYSILLFFVASIAMGQEVNRENDVLASFGLGAAFETAARIMEENEGQGVGYLHGRVQVNYDNTGNDGRRSVGFSSEVVDGGINPDSRRGNNYVQHQSNFYARRGFGGDDSQFVISADVNLRMRYDYANSPFIGYGNDQQDGRFFVRPVATGGAGYRVSNGNVDFIILPQVGVNMIDGSLVVGGLAGVNSDRAFASIMAQHNFSDNFDMRNDSAFFIMEADAGVRFACVGSKTGPVQQSAANGACFAIVGEYERMSTRFIDSATCEPVCGEEFDHQVYQAGFLNLRIEF